MKFFRNVMILVFALGSGLESKAQIVIDSNDLPQAGITYDVVNTAITDFNLVDISGPDVTWDASSLIALGDAPIEPVDINNASITAALVFNSPFNSTYQCDYYLPTVFPDLGIEIPIPLEGFNNFYQTSGDHYAIAGVGLSASGFDLPVTYDDIDEFFPIPFSFEESFESTAAFELNLEGILSYALDQTRSVTADAWGTLILPGGSFSVLRTRTELNAIDDISIAQLGEPFTIERDQVIYQWWGTGTGVPLLEITEIMGIPALATFQNISGSSGLMPVEPSAMNIYPNPVRAGGTLNLGSKMHSYSIFNIQGNKIKDGKSSSIDIPSNWSTGNYKILIDGKLERFVIQR
ncbi:MAG: hypothetical protein CL834_08095 [Crocinitomicaceae bacterium]|nr:hypothetical protein [Crocinitomicaceae bacterium]|tara:strand:+ start:3071 stop:4117 length:1047 start_codon:yes stop_codon:yes gene_type:complete